MSKIHIYVGLNIQNLVFQCGGGPQGFEGEHHIEKGVVHYSANGTHRHLIEQGLHAQKVAEKVLQDIKYCDRNWHLHISTHSDIVVNLIGILIHHGYIKAEDVKIFGMSEDNQSVQFESTYHPKGYLENWPYGFLDFDSVAARAKVGFSLSLEA